MIYWLSFCDPDLPKGTRFLGACLIEARSLLEAIHEAHACGINPGGEILSHELGDPSLPQLVNEYSRRLLSPSDVKELDDKLALAKIRTTDLSRRCRKR